MIRETPMGAIDGMNSQFVVSNTPATKLIFRNGVLQDGDDYTIDNKLGLNMTQPPLIGDVLTVLHCS